MTNRQSAGRLGYGACAAFAIFIPALPCAADVGLPMVIPSLVLMVPSLPVIVLIEGYVLKRTADISFRRGTTSAAFANIISTLIGMPIAWSTFLLVELGLQYARVEPSNSNTLLQALMFIGEAAWVGPPVDGQDAWRVYLAFLVLLVPYFSASVWIENHLVRWSLAKDGADREALYRGVVRGNLITYALLATFLLANIVYTLVRSTPPSSVM